MGKFILYLTIPIALLVILGLLFSLNKIVGKSMEPTLKNGQLAVFRRAFLGGEPRRSLIVIYEPQQPGDVRVGRILAEPKDSVRIQNGKVYIDNNAGKYEITEEYVAKGAETHANLENTWVKINEFNYLIVPDDRKDFILDFDQKQIHRNKIVGFLILKL